MSCYILPISGQGLGRLTTLTEVTCTIGGSINLNNISGNSLAMGNIIWNECTSWNSNPTSRNLL